MEDIYVCFGWLLRNKLHLKAYYSVLNGFLSSLIGDSVTVYDAFQSENTPNDTYTARLNICSQNNRGEYQLFQIQTCYRNDYINKIISGISELTEISKNHFIPTNKPNKIINITISYETSQICEDNVYCGKSILYGLKTHKEFPLLPTLDGIKDIVCPELKESPIFYLLFVNEYRFYDKNYANTPYTMMSPLEEWMYFLNTGRIHRLFTAKGLNEYKEYFNRERITSKEKEQYERYLKGIQIERNILASKYDEYLTAHFDGRIKSLGKQLASKINKYIKTNPDKYDLMKNRVTDCY
jgi:hypothetical protein